MKSPAVSMSTSLAAWMRMQFWSLRNTTKVQGAHSWILGFLICSFQTIYRYELKRRGGKVLAFIFIINWAGSEEEMKDIKGFYEKHKGDVLKVIDSLFFADILGDDLERIERIIAQLVAAGDLVEIPRSKSFEAQKKRKISKVGLTTYSSCPVLLYCRVLDHFMNLFSCFFTVRQRRRRPKPPRFWKRCKRSGLFPSWIPRLICMLPSWLAVKLAGSLSWTIWKPSIPQWKARSLVPRNHVATRMEIESLSIFFCNSRRYSHT